MKIEKKEPPKPLTRWPFHKLKPGDSVLIEGEIRGAIIMAFYQYLAKGRYSLRKEGKGFRFYLLNNKEK